MLDIFDSLLSIEERFSRWDSIGFATPLETKHGVACVLDDVVDQLCKPGILNECGWVRCEPRSPDRCESRYTMRWTDESVLRSNAFATLIGQRFSPYRRYRVDPVFHEFQLTIFQESTGIESVECGLCLKVFAQYSDGCRMQVRHVELIDQFPQAVRLVIADGDSLPDNVLISNYPMTGLLLLFASVLETVICERE